MRVSRFKDAKGLGMLETLLYSDAQYSMPLSDDPAKQRLAHSFKAPDDDTTIYCGLLQGDATNLSPSRPMALRVKGSNTA